MAIELYCLARFLATVENFAQVCVRFRIIGVEPVYMPEGRFRFFEFIHSGQHNPQIVVGVRMIWFERNSPPVCCNCLVEAAAGTMGVTEVDMKIRIGRKELNCSLK